MATTTTLSKAEYLKRYMDGDSDIKKKKKKKKVATVVPRSRIVDDDHDFQTLLPDNLENTLEEDVGDNEPTIAGIIDERPEYVQNLERYREGDGRWKGLESESDISRGDQKRKRHDSDSDNSPQRRQRHDSNSDQSPPRRQRHDSDSDQSLPRRQRHDSGSDISPPRRKRPDSGSDISPPRRKRPDSGSDISPPRRKRHDSGSDQSPPRKSSSKTKLSRFDSDRSQQRKDSQRLKSRQSDSDQSPPRKGNHGKRDDTPLKRQKHQSDSDHSPPRRRKNGRKSRFDQDDQSSSSKISDSSEKDDKMKKTLSGKKAGLSSARDMRDEANIMKQKENEAFRKIDKDKLGKDAATVYRDRKSGKRRNMAEEAEEQREKDEKMAAQEAKYQAWGQGMKQKADQEALLTDHLHEMSKPLARHRDDKDLDDLLKDQEREGDPMLAFLNKKKKKQDGTKKKEYPVYKGAPAPPNRFGIKPGYRWDGVNRSNGFESQLFAKTASRKATANDAYKWSTEDM